MRFKCCKTIRHYFRCSFSCRCCEAEMDCENDLNVVQPKKIVVSENDDGMF